MIYSLIINGSDEVISFSSVTDFTESLSATVTMHETEVGFPVSDNVVFSNPEFSISGVFSYYNSMTREIILENGEFVVREFNSKASPVESHVDIEKRIRAVYESKQPFSIIKSTSLDDVTGTEVDRIKSCVMRGLTFNTTSDRHGAVFPSMQIVQVRQAEILEEDVPNAKPQIVPIVDKSATSTNVKQTTESGTNNQPNPLSSDPTAAKKEAEELAKEKGLFETKRTDLTKSVKSDIDNGYQYLEKQRQVYELNKQGVKADLEFINKQWVISKP